MKTYKVQFVVSAESLGELLVLFSQHQFNELHITSTDETVEDKRERTPDWFTPQLRFIMTSIKEAGARHGSDIRVQDVIDATKGKDPKWGDMNARQVSNAVSRLCNRGFLKRTKRGHYSVIKFSIRGEQ